MPISFLFIEKKCNLLKYEGSYRNQMESNKFLFSLKLDGA